RQQVSTLQFTLTSQTKNEKRQQTNCTSKVLHQSFGLLNLCTKHFTSHNWSERNLCTQLLTDSQSQCSFSRSRCSSQQNSSSTHLLCLDQVDNQSTCLSGGRLPYETRGNVF